MSVAAASSVYDEAMEYFQTAFPDAALQALSLVGQGISIIGPDYRILWASPALQAWAGPLDEIRGRLCHEVYQRRDEVCANCPSAQAFATGERASSLQPGFATDGTPLCFELTSVPIKDADGVARLVMEVATDITEALRTQERERLLTTLLDHSPEMVVFIDPDGMITDVNAAAVDALQRTREEVIGERADALLGRRLSEDEFRRMLEASLTTGWRGQLPQVTRSGDTGWIELSTAPVKDAEGHSIGVIGVATDITERKQAEEELRFKNVLLESQLEASLDGILVVDDDANILSYNRRFAAAWGMPEELLVSGSGEQVLQWALDHLEDPERFLAHVRYLIEHPDEESVDEFVRRDGHTLERFSAPIKGPDGTYYGRIFSERDITERKEAEHALRRSETLNRSLVEHLPQRIFIKDRDSVYVVCNANYARDLGIEPESMVGKDDYAFHPKELADAYRADDREVMETGTLKHTEEEYLADGEERWVHTIKLPYRDERGDVVGLLGIFEDITERKQADKERGRLVHDLGNRVRELRCLHALTQLVERKPPLDLLLQEAADLLPPAWQYPEIACARIVFEGREYPTAGFRETEWKQAAQIRLRGEPVGSIEVCYLEGRPEADEGPFVQEERDLIDTIAERLGTAIERRQAEAAVRKHEQSLQASNARLAEMTQEMQQFLYLVSHDLRSPLVTVEGFASRLLVRHAEECGEEARHSLERIRAAVGSMGRLIEGLLQLSRTNTKQLTPTWLNMGEIAAEVARDLEQQATDAGVRVEIQPEQPRAWGDARAAYQILLNLVSNAVKYHGDADPYVRVGGEAREGAVEFTVRDNGLGIEADSLERVFQMFTRADTSGRPGLGIGLAGAKRLVERHGGRIWAESVPGQGSTFRFTLPHPEASDG